MIEERWELKMRLDPVTRLFGSEEEEKVSTVNSASLEQQLLRMRH